LGNLDTVRGYVARLLEENTDYRLREELGNESILECMGLIFTVRADEDEDWLTLYCRVVAIDELPDGAIAEVFKSLLAFNFGPTGNGAFALNDDQRFVVFRAQRILSGLDWSEFLDLAINVLQVTYEVRKANF